MHAYSDTVYHNINGWVIGYVWYRLDWRAPVL